MLEFSIFSFNTMFSKGFFLHVIETKKHLEKGEMSSIKAESKINEAKIMEFVTKWEKLTQLKEKMLVASTFSLSSDILTPFETVTCFHA